MGVGIFQILVEQQYLHEKVNGYVCHIHDIQRIFNMEVCSVKALLCNKEGKVLLATPKGEGYNTELISDVDPGMFILILSAEEFEKIKKRTP